MQHVDEGLLHAYLDGELNSLSAEKATDVERHLAGCPLCRARLATAQGERTEAERILRLAAPTARPAPALEALRARASRRSQPLRRPAVDHRRALQRRGAALGWAASLVIALSAGWFASEIRFRMSDAPVYTAREMQAVPAPTVAAAPEAVEVAPAPRSAPVAPASQREQLTASEFYALQAALPTLDQFQRDPAAALASLRGWESANPELAQAYPAVHVLRWYQTEADRAMREAQASAVPAPPTFGGSEAAPGPRFVAFQAVAQVGVQGP